MEDHHGAIEAHEVTMEAQHGTVEVHQVTMEAHHGAVEAHNGAMEDHHSADGLTKSSWRLTMAPWSHHDGIFHRVLVSDTAITKNLIDSSAATMDFPQCLKSTRQSQVIPIMKHLTVLCFLKLEG
jgi:hypothetical protein